MRAFPLLAGLAGALLFGPTMQPAAAAERQPFEIVKEWEVERTIGDSSANPCIMTYAYEDKDDNNAANAVIFALKDNSAVLVLVYQGWGFEKDEQIKVPLYLDKKPIKLKTTWTGDGKTLLALLPDSIVPDLLAAKTVILRFEDGDADFKIPNFAAGYEALRRCDATPAKAAPAPQAANPAPPPAAPAPAEPSQQKIAAYIVGLSVQRVLRECDFPSTGRDRGAVDAKLAAIQPDLAPIETELRAAMKKSGEHCPKAEKQGEFEAVMRNFIQMSPEELAVALEQKGPGETAPAASPPKL